jgi:hypothetical protein
MALIPSVIVVYSCIWRCRVEKRAREQVRGEDGDVGGGVRLRPVRG